MTATAAPSAHRGNVAIFYRKAEHFSIEELRLCGPNVTSFQMVTGRRGWHAVGCYITPSDVSIIEDIAAAIRDQPYGAELLVARDINSNLADPEDTPRAEAIEDELAATGLTDMGFHFLPRHKPWLKNRCTWIMQQDG